MKNSSKDKNIVKASDASFKINRIALTTEVKGSIEAFEMLLKLKTSKFDEFKSVEVAPVGKKLNPTFE